MEFNGAWRTAAWVAAILFALSMLCSCGMGYLLS